MAFDVCSPGVAHFERIYADEAAMADHPEISVKRMELRHSGSALVERGRRRSGPLLAAGFVAGGASADAGNGQLN